MKKLLVLLSVLLITTVLAGDNTFIAKESNRFVSICDFKMVPLGTGLFKNFSFVNVTGECAWDPALNGEYLTLSFIPNDFDGKALELQLENNIRIFNSAVATNEGLILDVTQDTMNEAGDVFQVNLLIKVVPVGEKVFEVDVVNK